MRSFLFGFLLFVLWSIFARWYYICQIRHFCEDNPTTTAIQETTAKTLSLKYKDSLVLSGYDQFSFPSTAVEPSPLSQNNNDFLTATSNYLKANPQKMLTITGAYRTSEANEKSGFFENLGAARAAAVRNLLVKAGIPEDRILIDYKEVADSDFSETLMFNVSDKLTNAAAPATNQFVFTNMTFSDANFESNSAVFKPSPQFEAYADSVVTYIKLNPNKKLAITGHTDNVGADAANMSLGKRRAVAVRSYFIDKGVKGQIATDSKGELQPMASNDTEEGRSKNRRVNIRIE
ncbi:MAG: OmpA family protein [Saprospiraceae bacterium]|nr:OmpA family protein [Saprospiraceae bacterium]